MPAPAVYVLAIVGTVAAGIAFKEFVYDPHIAPAFERWTDEFRARRREKKRQHQLTSLISTPSASVMGLPTKRYKDGGNDSEDDYGEPSEDEADGDGKGKGKGKGKTYEMERLDGNSKEREGLRRRKAGIEDETTEDSIRYPVIQPTPVNSRARHNSTRTTGSAINNINTEPATHVSPSAPVPSSSLSPMLTASFLSSASTSHGPSPGPKQTTQTHSVSLSTPLGWTPAPAPATQILLPSPIRSATQSPFLDPSPPPSQPQRTPLSLSLTHPLDIDLELLSASSEASYADAGTHLEVLSDYSDFRSSDGARGEVFSDFSDVGSEAGGRGEVLFEGDSASVSGSEIGFEGRESASEVERGRGDESVLWEDHADADGDALSESSWASVDSGRPGL